MPAVRRKDEAQKELARLVKEYGKDGVLSFSKTPLMTKLARIRTQAKSYGRVFFSPAHYLFSNRPELESMALQFTGE